MPESSTTRRLGLAAALLVFTVFLSRVLGFLRDAVIAALFGATGRTDAFYAAFSIPDWLMYVVAGGTLSITFIPIYTRHLRADDEAGGNRVLSVIATVMTIVLVIGIVVVEYFTPALTERYLGKLHPEHIDLAITLTRILLPAQLFFYLGGIASATLFTRKRFVAVSMAPLVYNAGIIVGGAVFGRRFGIASLAWGALAGAAVGQFGILVVAAWRAGMRFRPSLAVRERGFREWLLASIPLMFAVTLVSADDWIMRYFAAADVGAISCLNYARKLVQVPIAVAAQAVAQASMPFFAQYWAEGRKKDLGDLVTSSARSSAAIAALAGCALIALGEPAVDLLFRRGHFSAAQVAPTAHYVMLFAAAIPLWAMQAIVSRAFYAAGDTLTPAVAGTLVTAAMLAVYWLGWRTLGPNGLVIASDLGIFLHTASLMLLLPRRLDTVNRRNIVVGTLRGYAVGALAAVPAWAAATWLPHGRLHGHLIVVIKLAVGGLVFVSLAALLARPLGADDIAGFIEQRILRRRGPTLPSRP
ncbi:MAG TPA: murein biosynthesis integral membrane protein MurJ [Polyangia bacterium]